MLASSVTAILSIFALTSSAAPTTSSADSLSIALHPDDQCAVTRGSSDGHPWPTNLTPGICYPVPDGFCSMEIYAPPTQGTLNVYAYDDCVEGPAYSTEMRGCISGFGFEAKAIKYTPA